MFMVGPNGSGKSNFLDSLRFVSDGLRSSLDHALRERGTIKEVRRRSGGHPNHFALRYDFTLPSGDFGYYAFRVGAKQAGSYEVQTEECSIKYILGERHYFKVQAGKLVNSSAKLSPAAVPDRLFLVAASGLPEFRPVFDALSRIQVYNLSPKEISSMQRPDPGDILRRDGGNAASVLQQLSPEAREYVKKNLSRIVPSLIDVDVKTLASQETLEFRQSVRGQSHPWRFLASSMSDGTLRAFAVLLAVFQSMKSEHYRNSPLLIGLEEPEVALHPAAAKVLLSALREGSRYCQVLVTSHSADLLDNSDIEADQIISVDNRNGITKIGSIDSAGRKMLKEKLFTPGELLRLDQISPDEDAISDVQDDGQLKLFEL
jgi:predicted ATPase